MYAKYGHLEDDYIASIYENPEDGRYDERYTVSLHHSGMPAFEYEVFDTLEEAKSWAKSELGVTHWRGFDGQFTARPD